MYRNTIIEIEKNIYEIRIETIIYESINITGR